MITKNWAQNIKTRPFYSTAADCRGRVAKKQRLCLQHNISKVVMQFMNDQR